MSTNFSSKDQFDIDSKNLLTKINKIDNKLVDIFSIKNPYAVNDKEICAVLLDFLAITKNDQLKSFILSVLSRSKIKFNGANLAACFDNSENQILKWEVCDTMAYGKCTGVENWVKFRLQDSALGRCREMLCLTAAELLSKDESCRILKEVFAEFPAHAAIGMGICGGQAEVDFLRERLKTIHGWQAETVQKKGINRIIYRLSAADPCKYT